MDIVPGESPCLPRAVRAKFLSILGGGHRFLLVMVICCRNRTDGGWRSTHSSEHPNLPRLGQTINPDRVSTTSRRLGGRRWRWWSGHDRFILRWRR
jgi:hypothetical protein